MTRLLVVEDEPAIAFGLRNDLVLEGYDVEVVGDGQAAIDRARLGSFDLILLDMMLPTKDGFAVCRELRRAHVRTPIIGLTARTGEADRVLGLELGADDYVAKPFSPLELRARIKAVLRRSSNLSDIHSFGEVVVDFGRCTLRRGDVPVELTALEFRVLRALLDADGRVLTREQLIERVWGPGIAITDRVVDNHVMNLRRKVEPTPAAPRYLLSARGLGYRFQNRDHDQTRS